MSPLFHLHTLSLLPSCLSLPQSIPPKLPECLLCPPIASQGAAAAEAVSWLRTLGHSVSWGDYRGQPVHLLFLCCLLIFQPLGSQREEAPWWLGRPFWKCQTTTGGKLGSMGWVRENSCVFCQVNCLGPQKMRAAWNSGHASFLVP